MSSHWEDLNFWWTKQNPGWTGFYCNLLRWFLHSGCPDSWGLVPVCTTAWFNVSCSLDCSSKSPWWQHENFVVCLKKSQSFVCTLVCASVWLSHVVANQIRVWYSLSMRCKMRLQYKILLRAQGYGVAGKRSGRRLNLGNPCPVLLGIIVQVYGFHVFCCCSILSEKVTKLFTTQVLQFLMRWPHILPPTKLNVVCRLWNPKPSKDLEISHFQTPRSCPFLQIWSGRQSRGRKKWMSEPQTT